MEQELQEKPKNWKPYDPATDEWDAGKYQIYVNEKYEKRKKDQEARRQFYL